MKRHFPFLWLTIFFNLGILLHGFRLFTVDIIAVVSVVFLSAAYIFRQRKYIFVILIAVEFLLLGWLCTHGRWMFVQDNIYYQKSKTDFSVLSVRGIISSPPRRSDVGYSQRLSFVLSLREVKIAGQWQEISGKVLVNVFQNLPLIFGDDIVLIGKLHSPFEFSHDRKFSYRTYLKRQGIYFALSVKKDSAVEVLRRQQSPLLVKLLYQLRINASHVISRHLNPVQAALMQAMILGERLNIPSSIKDIFVKTGTTHILAISGLNVGIVVMVLFILLRMIPGPRAMTYTFTMIFVVFYVFLTGASPSVVRAGIMSVVFLTSFVIERETNSINSLSFAAFLILLLDPQNIFDIGFQLSFISVFGILLFYPLFIYLLKPLLKQFKSSILKFLVESFAVSLSATLAVAGLIAYYFNIVTPISLFANLVVVPLSTLATILGIGMLLTAGSIPFFAICIQFVLNLMVWFMAFCQHLPLAYCYFKDVNIWSVISYYSFVIAFYLFLNENFYPSADL